MSRTERRRSLIGDWNLGLRIAHARGVSNAVGDRDPRGWKIAQALAAARRAALELFARDDWGEPA